LLSYEKEVVSSRWKKGKNGQGESDRLVIYVDSSRRFVSVLEKKEGGVNIDLSKNWVLFLAKKDSYGEKGGKEQPVG